MSAYINLIYEQIIFEANFDAIINEENKRYELFKNNVISEESLMDYLISFFVKVQNLLKDSLSFLNHHLMLL